MKKITLSSLALIMLIGNVYAAKNCIKLTKNDGTVTYTILASVCHKHCEVKWSKDPNNQCNQACKNPSFYNEECGKK